MTSLTSANHCSNHSRSNGHCNRLEIQLAASETLQDHITYRSGKLAIYVSVEGDSTWYDHQVLSVPYQIRTLPARQCHLYTKGHFITFDQQRCDVIPRGSLGKVLLINSKFSFRYDFYHPGLFVLHKNEFAQFQVQVRFQRLAGASANESSSALSQNRICAVAARDGRELVVIDMCERKNTTHSPQIKLIGEEIKLSQARRVILVTISV